MVAVKQVLLHSLWSMQCDTWLAAMPMYIDDSKYNVLGQFSVDVLQMRIEPRNVAVEADHFLVLLMRSANRALAGP